MTIVNITTQNDADFYRTFIWQTVAGPPIDLTGGVMEMMLRRHAPDQAAVLRLGSDTGEIVFTNAIAGQFTVRITQDALEHLAARRLRPVQHLQPQRLQGPGLDRHPRQQCRADTMSEVEVINNIDVTTAPGDAAVVVVLEDDVEVIQTMEQGPPGPPGR